MNSKYKWKIGWGTGIAAAYSVFVLISIGVVVYWMNQDVDLVTPDYYEKELKYEQQIETIKRTDNLDKNLSIFKENNYIKLIFPKLDDYKKFSGDVLFYRPSDYKQDYSIKLKVDSSYTVLIATPKLKAGYWKVKVNWNVDTTKYYTEKSIIIN